MTLLQLIQEKVAYNQWANQEVIKWLQNQPAETFQKPLQFSYANLNQLLHHMMEAQKYYFAIIRQKEENYEEEMETALIIKELTLIDQELNNWLALQSDSDLTKTISLKRSPFTENYLVSALITHIVNHSTYHRGQLIALRHQLNLLNPPKTDYYRFLMAQTQ